MSNFVNFSQTFQPTFSTQTLIPISLLTDSVAFTYSPGATASGPQLTTLFALATHLCRDSHDRVQKVVVIGDHGTLLAKILLNLSTDYIVDTIVKSYDEQQAANNYINSPNLFKCFYFGPHLVSTPFAAFADYDIAIFTDVVSPASLPASLPTSVTTVMRVECEQSNATAFDAHDTSSARLTVSRISTLTTGTDKIFTISGTIKNG